MMRKSIARTLLWSCAALVFLRAITGWAAEEPVTREQFLLLQQQNEKLQQQLEKQQQLIDSLTHKVSEIQDVNAKRDRELGDLKTEVKESSDAPASASPMHFGKVNISGEGGIAFFKSQINGQTPNSEFRIDEARLFLEAPIWDEVYFFTEIDLATPESTGLNLSVGELYLDWQNISKLWDRERWLNLRAGRFYIPFGEEYMNRFAIDNPLISRSLSDVWGSDDGVELYGRISGVQYVLAVQSGGDALGGGFAPTMRDYTGDKSVAGRIGYDPTKWLHLSVSGMRTGDLDANNDGLSAVWFGNGWFRSLGGPATTHFHANLVEGDVQFHFPWLQVKTAGGYVKTGDNDPVNNNSRDVYYYYVEAEHDFTHKFYGAARFSEIIASRGLPIVGNGNVGQYMFGPDLTKDYWRLSLGMGYRFNSRLMVKGEYSFNRGSETTGERRGHEDLFALEAAFKF